MSLTGAVAAQAAFAALEARAEGEAAVRRKPSNALRVVTTRACSVLSAMSPIPLLVQVVNPLATAPVQGTVTQKVRRISIPPLLHPRAARLPGAGRTAA